MPTRKQVIERYTELIRVMRGLSRHERRYHFEMSNWGIETECGTSMCAAGFCGSDSWFKRRGFRTVPDLGNPGKLTVQRKTRTFEIKSWPAIKEFFGTETSTGNSGMYHPVFGEPNSVGEIIRAAQREIKFLKEAA